MSKPKVVIDPHPRQIDWVFAPEDFQRLDEMVEIVWGRNDPMPVETFQQLQQELFAVVTCGWRFGSITHMSNLRAILEVSGGHPSHQSLDYTTCFQKGIRVLSCAPAFGPMVAELALGLAIASARGIVEGDRLFRVGQEKYSRAGNGEAFTLYGRRVGLIGFGGLARALKPLLEPFGCEFFVYDPWLTPRYLQKLGMIPTDLETLLQSCRIIFVLAVPSQENRAMLDRRLLEMIQPDAVLLLISRAHLVDFDALVDLVNQGRFRAAIDVFPTEPAPLDHPVRQTKNTILSAHRAGHVPDDFRAIGRMVVDDLETLINGLPPTEMQIAQPEIIRRLR